MNVLFRKAGLGALALASLLSLVACLGDARTAGGDDFPNSVQNLGRTGAAESADSSDWNGWSQAPSSPPEAYDTTDAPDDVPQDSAGLGKRAADEDGRVLPARDLAGAVRSVVRGLDTGGVLRAVRVQTLPGLGVVARDTTWYRTGLGALLPQRILRVSGTVTYPLGREERFSYEDADGDGWLTALGASSLARVRLQTVRASGLVEERTRVIAAGPDLSFRGVADNRLLSLTLVQRTGSDTLSSLSVVPAPGDSSVRDPRRDSCRVDVEHHLSVGSGRLARFYRAVLFGDSTRDYPRRFRSVLQTAAGTTETLLLGRDSSSDFAPRDSGYVRLAFVSSRAQDTVSAATTVYRVVLADTAGRFGGNRLVRVDRAKSYRLGAVASSRFVLTPISPVADGARARAGAADLRVDLRAGGWAVFTGTASLTGLDGTWTDGAGASGTVRFDTRGRILSGSTR